MRAKRGSLPLFVLTLFLAGVLEARGESKPLLKSPTRQGSPKLKPDPRVIRQRPVVVDLGQLKSRDNQRLELPLFDGTRIVLIRDEKESGPSGVFVWEGEVEGQPGSMAILATTKDVLFGDVMTRDSRGAFGFYQIRYLGKGLHVLKEVDPSKFPEEEGGTGKKRERQAIRPRDRNEASGFYLARHSEYSEHSEVLVPDCEDPATQIDVLVVYTDAARGEAGGKDAMTLLIESAVRSTNRSYRKSGVTQRLRLVHTERVEYAESTRLDTDLERLVNTSDRFLKYVPETRDTYAADVVVLIVTARDFDCGWSEVMPTVSHDNESKAYAVVPHDCAGSPRWSFAHELGHIMGARHNRDDDKIEGKPFPFNHGYVRRSAPAGSRWHTIMAKQLEGCGSDSEPACTTRIPRWSNPDPAVRYPNASGELTGDPDHDNHRALEETASTVANFRCASP